MPDPLLHQLADNFVMFSGITERYFELLSDEDLNWKPRDDMRTVRDLVVHLLEGIQLTCTCVKKGEIKNEDQEAITKELQGYTVAQLVAYSKKMRKLHVDTVKNASDADLQKIIHVFYGEFPWATMLGFTYDEHLHHRGQLSVYLRLMGKELPFAYDYEHNVPLV